MERGALSGRTLRWIAALVVVANGIFPALWILFTSLKTEGELTRIPITWFPHEPTLANYVRAFADQPLALFLFNSVVVALLATAATLFVSVLAAYALARLQVRFRDLILSAIIAGEGKRLNKARAAALSLSYVLGMAVAYAAAGVAAAYSGSMIAAALQALTSCACPGSCTSICIRPKAACAAARSRRSPRWECSQR